MYQSSRTREIATTVHRWGNERRRQRGLDALSGRSGLNRAAERHSRRMAEAGTVSHRLGVAPQDKSDQFRIVGENIYKTWGDDSPHDAAASALDAWMTSDGHRRALLNASARLDGVGVHIRGDTAFITHLFASERSVA
jgi:uncharacterized protein YkwD